MNKLNISVITLLALTMASCSSSVGIDSQDPANSLEAVSNSKEKNASNKGDMVEICHVANGQNDRNQTMVVSSSAAAQHLANHAGDRVGNCEVAPPPPNTAPTISYEGGSDLNSLGDGSTAGILISVSDIDNDALTVEAEITAGSARIGLLTVSSSGVYNFALSPLGGVESSGTVTFTVSDGTATTSLSLDYFVSEE